MTRKTKWEVALWAACMLTGSTVLFAQWHVSAHRFKPADPAPFSEEDAWLFAPVAHLVAETKPEATTAQLPVAPATAAVLPGPTPAEPAKPAMDTKLVAKLLVDSVTQVESAGNPRMVGRHGERGLMQIKAGAWGEVTRRLFGRRVSFDRAFEGKLNQQVGSAYLADLQRYLGRHRKMWKADERSLLLACYNAGPERVKRSGFDLRRLPAHTRDYVKRASNLHDALLADHQVDPARIRLALHSQSGIAGGS